MAVEGFEADDLIANAVALAQERGAAQVVIVSTDKDLCQLVTEPGLGDGQAARRARTAPPSRPSRPSRAAAQPHARAMRCGGSAQLRPTPPPLSTRCRYCWLPACLEPLRSRLGASRKQRPMLAHGGDVVPVVQALCCTLLPCYTLLRSG